MFNIFQTETSPNTNAFPKYKTDKSLFASINHSHIFLHLIFGTNVHSYLKATVVHFRLVYFLILLLTSSMFNIFIFSFCNDIVKHSKKIWKHPKKWGKPCETAMHGKIVRKKLSKNTYIKA